MAVKKHVPAKGGKAAGKFEKKLTKAAKVPAKAAKSFMGTLSPESAYTWRRREGRSLKAGCDWRVDDERR